MLCWVDMGRSFNFLHRMHGVYAHRHLTFYMGLSTPWEIYMKIHARVKESINRSNNSSPLLMHDCICVCKTQANNLAHSDTICCALPKINRIMSRPQVYRWEVDWGICCGAPHAASCQLHSGHLRHFWTFVGNVTWGEREQQWLEFQDHVSR